MSDKIFTPEEIDKYERLLHSDNWTDHVRCARDGYGLDKLINDEDYNVRAAVARYGYGLDKLINNKILYVRDTVERYLEKHNLTLDEWKQQNPDKCVLSENKPKAKVKSNVER